MKKTTECRATVSQIATINSQAVTPDSVGRDLLVSIANTLLDEPLLTLPQGRQIKRPDPQRVGICTYNMHIVNLG